jgi:hypothetical protein
VVNPETILAINQAAKKTKRFDKIAEELQKMGINATCEKINDNGKMRKVLVFHDTGEKIVDSNGNGGLDNADFNLKGAVDDIRTKFGLGNAKDFNAFTEKATSAAARASLSRVNSMFSPFMSGLDEETARGMDLFSLLNWLGSQNPYLDMNQFTPFFAKAMMYADDNKAAA